MPADLSKSLVIGISSRALFNLEAANQVFLDGGKTAYAKHQVEHENDILLPGPGFPIVKSILELNKKVDGHRPAEVVIMSRNSPATSLRLFHSIDHYGLDIQRAVLSGGAPLSPYLAAFSVDLYMSMDESDVEKAVGSGIAAAVIYPTPNPVNPSEGIRIAFDGDAVLFSDEADRIYREQGPDAFFEHERKNAQNPLPEGPFNRLLRTLAILQKSPQFEHSPIRTALVTARGLPAHLRVLYTLRAWDIEIDEAFFMGGVPKTEVLKAFRPHIFFDDQESHCQPASQVVPTARVPLSELFQQTVAEPSRERLTEVTTADSSPSDPPAPVELSTSIGANDPPPAKGLLPDTHQA